MTKLNQPSRIKRRLPLIIRFMGCFSVLLLVCMVNAQAELPVIFDQRNTQPIPEFAAEPAVPDTLPPFDPGQQAAGFLAGLFPVTTPELSPGIEPRRSVKLNMITPVFLIGSDDQSRNWFVQFKDRLAAIGAAGLVVEVPTLAAFKDLQALAPGLHLSPVSCSDLAIQLGIKHIPVLISASGIEQ